MTTIKATLNEDFNFITVFVQATKDGKKATQSIIIKLSQKEISELEKAKAEVRKRLNQ